jgi:hypothetical protein
MGFFFIIRDGKELFITCEAEARLAALKYARHLGTSTVVVETDSLNLLMALNQDTYDLATLELKRG